MSINSEKFALGTFASGASPEFAGWVLADSVCPLPALNSLLANNGLQLTSDQSVIALLEDWSHNNTVLNKALALLATDVAFAAGIEKELLAESTLRVLPPINLPRQILCSGANYFKHVVDIIVEMGPGRNPSTEGMNKEQLREFAENLMRQRQKHGEPYFFCKPVSAICGANDPIPLLDIAEQPDWELELAVVIGKAAFQVSQADAMDYVAGYTIANDVSNRGQIYRKDDMKAMGTDWISSKSSPAYLPLGPYLVPKQFVENPAELQIQLALNGELKQDESTSDMIFGIPRLLEYLTQRVRLFPGDIICTGSPAGNGVLYNRFLQAGDVMDATISGLGKQHNPVTRNQGSK